MSGAFPPAFDLPVALVAVGLVLLSLLGWGRMTLRFPGGQTDADPGLFTTLLCGWGAVVFLAQLVHLFFPLSGWVNLAILGPGLVYQGVVRRPGALSTSGRTPAWVLMIVAIVTAWGTARSMAQPTYYDAGLYYFGMIEWTQAFEIVPGLGNLHGRFAFNSSEFAYASLTTFPQLSPNAHSLGNVVFLAIVTGWLLTKVAQADRSRSFAEALPAMLVLPLLIRQVLQFDWLASPVPEFVSGTIHLILFVILAGAVLFSRTDPSDADLLTASLLCGTALTIKLSTIGYVASFVFLLLLRSVSIRTSVRGIARLLLFAAVPVVVWVVRGYVLSGYPAYPSRVGGIAFDWMVPAEQAIDDANWIYSWARAPGKHWKEVLGNWDWFRPWLSTMVADRWLLRVIAAGLLLLLYRCAVSLGRGPSLMRRSWWLFLPIATQIAFWFITAPDPRFANNALELSGIAALLVALDHWNLEERVRRGRWIYIATLLTLLPSTLNVARHPEWFTNVSTGWMPVPAGEVKQETLGDNAPVFRPSSGDQCWCAPLPCSPTIQTNLQLRSPGKLGSGFRIERPQ